MVLKNIYRLNSLKIIATLFVLGVIQVISIFSHTHFDNKEVADKNQFSNLKKIKHKIRDFDNRREGVDIDKPATQAKLNLICVRALSDTKTSEAYPDSFRIKLYINESGRYTIAVREIKKNYFMLPNNHHWDKLSACFSWPSTICRDLEIKLSDLYATAFSDTARQVFFVPVFLFGQEEPEAKYIKFSFIATQWVNLENISISKKNPRQIIFQKSLYQMQPNEPIDVIWDFSATKSQIKGDYFILSVEASFWEGIPPRPGDKIPFDYEFILQHSIINNNSHNQ